MITEKNYNDIATRVYAVEEGKENYTITAGYSFNSNGQNYEVIKVADNPSNGMQAMAVAPIGADGQLDTSQVIIAYAGTNFGDSFSRDVLTDVESVAGGSHNYRDLGVVTDSQFNTAKDFATEVEDEYPAATITTTGHSLGQSVAMYVALEKGYDNVGFNGPDIHNLIDENQVKYMQAHPEQFRNFRNPNDIIGNIMGDETGTAIYVDRKNAGMKDDHTVSGWTFDKDGNLVDDNGLVVTVGTVAGEAMKTFMTTTYQQKKTELSEGGLTGHEKIFLDYISASAAAASLSTVVTQGKTLVEGIRDTAKKEFEALYDTIKQRPTSVNKLTMEEIKAVYIEEGVTYSSMVETPTEHFEGRMKEANSILDNLQGVGEQVQIGINALVEKDTGLGDDITAWSVGI